MDIAEFLTARYDEEQQGAEGFETRDWVAEGANVRGGPRVRSAGPGPYMSYMVGEPFPDTIAVPLSREPLPDDFWKMVSLHGTTGKFESEMRNAEYIAYWDPARVLTDLAAKRAVLAYLQLVQDAILDNNLWGLDNPTTEALRHLAAPYAEHPDFDPSWRIDG